MKHAIFLLLSFALTFTSSFASAAIVFQEDFSGTAPQNNWIQSGNAQQEWTVNNGTYCIHIPEGSWNKYKRTHIEESNWRDYTFSFDWERTNGVDTSFIWRRQNEVVNYACSIRGGNFPNCNDFFDIRIFKNGSQVHGDYEIPVPGLFQTGLVSVTITAIGATQTISLNGTEVLSWTDEGDVIQCGGIGFEAFAAGCATIGMCLDNIQVDLIEPCYSPTPTPTFTPTPIDTPTPTPTQCGLTLIDASMTTGRTLSVSVFIYGGPIECPSIKRAIIVYAAVEVGGVFYFFPQLIEPEHGPIHQGTLERQQVIHIPVCAVYVEPLPFSISLKFYAATLLFQLSGFTLLGEVATDTITIQ